VAALGCCAALLSLMMYRQLRSQNTVAVRALTEKRYNILETIPDGFFIVDEKLRFTHVNEQAEKLLHRGAAELIGTNIGDLLDPLASELVPEMERVRASAEPLERLQHFQSTNTWCEIRIQPASDELLVYLRDVTERKRTELASQETESRVRVLLSQVPAVLWTVDLDMKLTSAAGAGLSVRGLKAEKLIGAPFEALVTHAEQKTVSISAVRRAFEGETVRYETREDSRWLQNDVEPLRDSDGKVIGAIGVTLDVTEVRESAERFSRLAREDVLTGLPNRLALEERLSPLLEEALSKKESVAVLFIDVDRFKNINDTLGHRTGDELLKAVSKRLRDRLSENAAIYRPGGDEFVVVMHGIRHKRTVATVAMDVLAAFQEPFEIEGRDLFVTGSVGASIFPQNAQTADELIAFADSAMYRAKESGRNNAKFYDGTMHAHVLERMGLEQDLRQALARDEMRLVFQPVVDTMTRRTIACEALVRWHHPLLGELSPMAFIPIAEESGLIVEIGRWVLREACRKASAMRQTLDPNFRIAVNLSPRDFYEQDFGAMLDTVLAETGLPPDALDLEVTESVMLNEVAVATLTRISAMGVHIVVDDFGTGYSSLNYIKRLPVNAIKIDKSFIDDVTRDSYDQGIVKAITTLAQTLNLRVVAEGIESEAQWDFIRSLRCDQAQGYFFHRPLPWEEVVNIVRRSEPTQRQTPANVIPLSRTGTN
jgi:diguanylate cyclase (GGDEF)-like protein/PAS domain S-box-containing protein